MATPADHDDGRGRSALDEAKTVFTHWVVNVLNVRHCASVADHQSECIKLFVAGRSAVGGRDLCLPVVALLSLLKKVSPSTLLPAAPALALELATDFQKQPEATALCREIAAEAGYVNFSLSIPFLARIISKIVDGSFLAPLSRLGKEAVMIEYSQPNTHKAFHVGHLRNVALGDSLVRLYEQLGHTVTAANYFGDEGQHIATCLWQLRREIAAQHPSASATPDFSAASLDLVLEAVPSKGRGEWLGGFYARGVEQLSLESLTIYPHPGFIAAKVLSKRPDPKLPFPWHQVALQLDNKTVPSVVSVLCSLNSYEVGDMVAFSPESRAPDLDTRGWILSTKDLSPGTKQTHELDKVPSSTVSTVSAEMKTKPVTKRHGLTKKKEPGLGGATAEQAFVLPTSVKLGARLTDLGKLESVVLPVGVSVEDEWKSRKAECDAILSAMEAGEAEVCALWRRTAAWSFEEFRRIYDWLGCRFDRDFTESEMGKVSLERVAKWEAEGKLDRLPNGAVGLDLAGRGHKGLGFCLLRKANGSGLYATKDLALAQRKFDEFKITRSLHVVASEQEHHFKQVFKTLELLGFENAKHCAHLAYGMVKLKSGKMSSRKGTVIFFSALQTRLNEHIMTSYLSKCLETPAGLDSKSAESSPQEGLWTQREVDRAVHVLSVATIKYGMLKQDSLQDIVFDLDEWAKNTGNTGPYLLYAYTRMKGVLRKVPAPDTSNVIDWKELTLPSERVLLLLLNDFWPLLQKTVVARNNPSALCDYLFNLCRHFSSWYEAIPFLKNETNVPLLLARRTLVEALSLLLKQGLHLLGIETLERM